MDELLHNFDDLELQGPSSSEDKGKEPVTYEDTDGEEEDYEEEEDQLQQQNKEDKQEEDSQPLVPEDSEPDDLTCAICLNSIQLENLAMVKDCDHMYCATCILHWAVHKESPWCPQCKQPFNYLLTYRALDGTLQDFPTEESVTLLKRALWFEDHVRRNLNDTSAAALLDESIAADDVAWHDYADDLDLDEDEIIEEYYFSAAAGRARVTLGNRRFGEGGYISGGRRQARPSNSNRNGSAKKNSASKGRKNSKHGCTGTPAVAKNSTAAATIGDDSSTNGSSTNGDSSSTSRSSITTPGALSSSLSLANNNNKATPPVPVPPAATSSCPLPMLEKRSSSSSGTPTITTSHSGAINIAHMSSNSSLLYGMSPAGSSGGSTPTLYGSSPSGFGRRARRNAKRAAMDAALAAASQAQAAAAAAVGSRTSSSDVAIVTEQGFTVPSSQREQESVPI